MPLVARASKTVRNKNILIILMCAVFMFWFAYDGFIGYAKTNDRLVEYMRDPGIKDGRISPEFLPAIEAWKGWSNEDSAGRKRMDDIVNSSKNRIKLEGWKSPIDVTIQQAIVASLVLATGGAVWWFFRCQKRRAIAEETTVSPAEGIVVPWDKITKVDNTRWKSTGIVEITYPDAQGQPRKSKFDDYELEREPLLAILDQLADKAINAEFIPKEDPLPETAPPAAPAKP